MSRPPGGSVHIGKAAAVIVITLALGFIVLNDKGGAGFTPVAATRVTVPSELTPTTLKSSSTSTTQVAERQPSQVRVVAINATGRAGAAGQATTRLRAAGYNVLQPGNATAAVTKTHPASVIYVVTPGYEKEALTIAALFKLPDSAVRTTLPTPSPSPDIHSDVNIAVLVGTGITT